jgi:hypothetical protein
MSKKRRATVRLKYGKRGYLFLIDQAVNTKRLCYYTTKRAARRGIARTMGEKPYLIVDETGMTERGTPKKR